MKRKQMIVLILSIIVIFLTACQSNENQTSKNEDPINTKEEDIEKDNVFTYGEGVKGEQYGITLQSAYTDLNAFDEINAPYMVIAVMEITNVTEDQSLNAESIGFQLISRESDTSYEGKLFRNMNSSDLTIGPDEKVHIDVAFVVESIEDTFILKASLFNEPSMKTEWRLDGLKQP